MNNNLPADRNIRMEKALLSLEGLSIGDAFGQTFFMPEEKALKSIASRRIPDPTWYYTDDTAMAISIVETLSKFERIDRDYLAKAFARSYLNDPNRGYGATASKILREISQDISWLEASSNAFSGMGSMGNGGSMRSGPIGAYFCDNYDRAVMEAKASSEVTHFHLEAQAGAIAVTVAAAYCARNEQFSNAIDLFETVVKFTPESETRSKIIRAKNIARESKIESVVSQLGNGTNLCAYDTVPIALWFAAFNLNNFTEAIWQAVSVLGDRDTICAIVGSIVALAVGREGLPQIWLDRREELKFN